MKSLSIVKKIWLLIALALIGFGAITSVSVYFGSQNNNTTEEMRLYMYETSKLASRVNADFSTLDEFFTQAVTLSDPDILSTAKSQSASINKHLVRLIELNPDQSEKLSSWQSLVTKYATESISIAEMFIEDKVDYGNLQKRIADKTNVSDTLKSNFRNYEQESDERFTKSAVELVSNMTSTTSTIGMLGVALVLCIGALGHYIAIEISRKAKALGDSLSELASGKGSLASRLDTTGNDELSYVGMEFNKFIAMLQNSIMEVTKNIEPLTKSAKDLSDGMGHLEKIANEQSQDSTTVSQSMEEMKQSVKEISQSASDAASSTLNANEIAKEGHTKASHAVENSKSLSVEIKQAQDVITELAAKTKNMTDILKSINDIADQTNLLALNAAIEAARAGDHGRGFSVVADEVRNLSSKTADSVLMVQNVLSELNSNVTGAVSIMDKAVRNAEHSAQLASDAGISIDCINQEIEKISMLNTQVAAATEEQTMVTEQIILNTNKMITSLGESIHIQESVKGISNDLMSLSSSLSQVGSKFRT